MHQHQTFCTFFIFHPNPRTPKWDFPSVPCLVVSESNLQVAISPTAYPTAGLGGLLHLGSTCRRNVSSFKTVVAYYMQSPWTIEPHSMCLRQTAFTFTPPFRFRCREKGARNESLSPKVWRLAILYGCSELTARPEIIWSILQGGSLYKSHNWTLYLCLAFLIYTFILLTRPERMAYKRHR